MTMKRTQTGFQKKKRDTLFNSTNTIENNKRTERLLAAIIATTKLSAVYNATQNVGQVLDRFLGNLHQRRSKPGCLGHCHWYRSGGSGTIGRYSTLIVEPSEGTLLNTVRSGTNLIFWGTVSIDAAAAPHPHVHHRGHRYPCTG